LGAGAVRVLAAGIFVALAACSDDGASDASACDQAEGLRQEILTQAYDAGVSGPCSPKDGGAVLAEFQAKCEKYEELLASCCASIPIRCH
jgi:hypothetical protein